MSGNMTPTKRFIVRTALVTSTTLATIMGAQALASIDAATLLQSTPISAESANQSTANAIPQTSNTNITAAAPNIVILRRGGESDNDDDDVRILVPSTNPTNQSGGATTVQVIPPNPVHVAPSQSVTQRFIPSTRSSR